MAGGYGKKSMDRTLKMLDPGQFMLILTLIIVIILIIMFPTAVLIVAILGLLFSIIVIISKDMKMIRSLRSGDSSDSDSSDSDSSSESDDEDTIRKRKSRSTPKKDKFYGYEGFVNAPGTGAAPGIGTAPGAGAAPGTDNRVAIDSEVDRLIEELNHNVPAKMQKDLLPDLQYTAKELDSGVINYPGSIMLDADSQWPANAAGSRDRTRLDEAAAPAGNVYNYGRTAAEPTPEVCFDGEANDEEIDADEQNTYQVRSRNDEVRVVAGTMQRQRNVDRYLREEVEEAEDREWWGRDEL